MLFLDTQAALWWLSNDPRLGATAKSIIAAADRPGLLSVASIWELEIKRAKGKYTGPSLAGLPPESGIDIVGINAAHAVLAAGLPTHHADPFDRMIVAQAIIEDCTLVTADAALSAYDVRIAW